MKFLTLTATLSLGAVTLVRAGDSKITQWNGYDQVEFAFENRPALLVQPKKSAEGKPWIWRTEFFAHEPQADLALLAAGWHVAYLKVSDMYGAPAAINAMAGFHDHLVKEHGLAKRSVLEGFSRGGLYAVNYAAAHPDHTAALYLDAPVLDIRSWPGGKGQGPGNPQCWKQCLEIYGSLRKPRETSVAIHSTTQRPSPGLASRLSVSAAMRMRRCRLKKTRRFSRSATARPAEKSKSFSSRVENTTPIP
jgi:pimeloyl-ACP methyl ester carboxylesterase